MAAVKAAARAMMAWMVQAATERHASACLVDAHLGGWRRRRWRADSGGGGDGGGGGGGACGGNGFSGGSGSAVSRCSRRSPQTEARDAAQTEAAASLRKPKPAPERDTYKYGVFTGRVPLTDLPGHNLLIIKFLFPSFLDFSFNS